MDIITKNIHQISYLLVLVMFSISTLECCYVDLYDIRCDCQESDLNSSQQFDTITGVYQSVLKFDRLMMQNCIFDPFTKEELAPKFAIHTLLLENVHLGQVYNNAFDHVKMINKFIHLNSEWSICPLFKSMDKKRDYLAALNSLANLKYLELCANNDGDVIPSRAFNQLENVEQIYFNGDYSAYTIETDAFSGLNNLISIVFNQMEFQYIQKNAFNLKIRQNSWPSIKNFTNIYFQNCSFINFSTCFDPNFNKDSTRPIQLTIKPRDTIPIESIRVFETFLSSQQNSLVIYRVACGDSKQFLYLLKKYWQRLEIDCLPSSLSHKLQGLDIFSSSTIPSISLLNMSSDFSNQTYDKASKNRQTIPEFEKTSSNHNRKQWFTTLDPVIMSSKPDPLELLDLVEKLPMVFNYDGLTKDDSYFKQMNIETRIEKFQSTTILNLQDDLIEMHRKFKQINKGYYVVKTIIKNRIMVTNYNNETTINLGLFLNSDVVSYNVLEIGSTNLIHDNVSIRIEFHNTKTRKYQDLVICVYWDLYKKDWLQYGCQFIEQESNSTITICQCNHLTSFAVLLDVSGRETENPHNRIKEILTYTCCGFSVLGLILSVWLMCHTGREKYQIYNDRFRWRMNRWVITLNTAICLLITNLLTLFGLDRRENQEICMVVSVVLLFFLLSSFCFMLLQGYHLFKSTMNPLIFDVNFGYYYLFGYGIPALIILILFLTIGINRHRLDQVLINKFFCWISAKRNPYYFLIIIIPVAVTMIINVIFFILFMINLVRRSYFLKKIDKENHIIKQRSRDNSNNDQLCKQSTSLILLLLNLGITWLLFLMYISDNMHYFSYLFIVINGSQGLFFLTNQIFMMRSKGRINFKKMNKNINKNYHSSTSKQTITMINSPSIISSNKYSASSTRALFKGLILTNDKKKNRFKN